MATATLITAEEFELMPDGERFELVSGTLREVTPPSFQHALLQGRLITRLSIFVMEQGLGEVVGEVGVILFREPDTVRGPDIAFVRTERLPEPGEQRRLLRIVPDLAIEIVSPNDKARDVTSKVLTYLDAGVPTVWVVDPGAQHVEVWNHDAPVQVIRAGDTLDGGDVLPGFRLPLADLFG